MSYQDADFKVAEIRVAAFTPLTAEEGRALYAGYVKERLIANKAAEENAKLRAALEKIADPRKRDHAEPDAYTTLGCVMNIAAEALQSCDEGDNK